MSQEVVLGVDRPRASEDDTALAVALAAAVHSVGRRLGSEPRRVQAMVVDALGTRTRSLRAEVDASVLAAEEGVPDLLADGRSATAALRLRARGLDTAVVEFALDAWRYALGMLAEGVEPPSLRRSLDRTAGGTITDRVDDVPPQATVVVIDDVPTSPAPACLLQLFAEPHAGPLGMAQAPASGAGHARPQATKVAVETPYGTWSGHAHVHVDLTGAGDITQHTPHTLTITVRCCAGHRSPTAECA
jgi:hypothetical protein